MDWFDVVNLAFLLLLCSASCFVLACKAWVQHELKSSCAKLLSSVLKHTRVFGSSTFINFIKLEDVDYIHSLIQEAVRKVARAEVHIVQLEADDQMVCARLAQLQIQITQLRIINLEHASNLNTERSNTGTAVGRLRTRIDKMPIDEELKAAICDKPALLTSLPSRARTSVPTIRCASTAAGTDTTASIVEIDISDQYERPVTGRTMTMRECDVHPIIWDCFVKHGLIVYCDEPSQSSLFVRLADDSSINGTQAMSGSDGNIRDVTEADSYAANGTDAANASEKRDSPVFEHIGQIVTETRDVHPDVESAAPVPGQQATPRTVPVEILRAGQFARFVGMQQSDGYDSVAAVANVTSFRGNIGKGLAKLFL